MNLNLYQRYTISEVVFRGYTTNSDLGVGQLLVFSLPFEISSSFWEPNSIRRVVRPKIYTKKQSTFMVLGKILKQNDLLFLDPLLSFPCLSFRACRLSASGLVRQTNFHKKASTICIFGQYFIQKATWVHRVVENVIEFLKGNSTGICLVFSSSRCFLRWHTESPDMHQRKSSTVKQRLFQQIGVKYELLHG